MADHIVAASGIYAIRNNQTGKQYIGGSSNIRHRWHVHACSLRKGRHHSAELQADWNLYGESAFSLVTLEIVAERSELVSREQYWIDITKSAVCGYNVCSVAGSTLGMKLSAETRAKLSERLVGNCYAKGYKHSEETRAKVAAAGRGRKHSAETRKKMSEAGKGKVFSPETIAKMSAAKKGRKLSAEQIARLTEISRSRPRKPLSQETKDKIRAKALERAASKKAAAATAERANDAVSE